MKEFKIRASKASVLLTAGGKTSVAQTPKTYFEEWLISNMTGKHKVIDSKYLRRGIESEEFAIAKVGKDLIKNKQYFENDYFIGTPDVITEDTVIDTKCSWDAFTFPFFMKYPPIQYVAQSMLFPIVFLGVVESIVHLTDHFQYPLCKHNTAFNDSRISDSRIAGTNTTQHIMIAR